MQSPKLDPERHIEIRKLRSSGGAQADIACTMAGAVPPWKKRQKFVVSRVN